MIPNSPRRGFGRDLPLAGDVCGHARLLDTALSPGSQLDLGEVEREVGVRRGGLIGDEAKEVLGDQGIDVTSEAASE